VSTVWLYMSMSLDGFVAGPNPDIEHPMGRGGERLHHWLDGADPADAQVAARMFSTATTGAVLMGRRTFDVGEGPWGDDGTFGMPCFVVTHRPADTRVKGPTTFTFVSGGVERGLVEARIAANGKRVNVMGASVAGQLLRSGLVDHVEISLIPVLLGGGVRLFESDVQAQIALERTGVIESAHATHLSFRVVR